MKARKILAAVAMLCAALQVTLVILDEFNPVMGFLIGPAPKIFLCVFSILVLILAIGVLKQPKQ